MDGPDWFKSLISPESEADRIMSKIIVQDNQEAEAELKKEVVNEEPNRDDADGEYLADLRKAQAELSTTDKLNILYFGLSGAGRPLREAPGPLLHRIDEEGEAERRKVEKSHQKL